MTQKKFNWGQWKHWIFPLFVALFFLVGCSSSDKQPEVPTKKAKAESPEDVLWPFAEKAVTIRYRTDKDLNFYETLPHSLVLCVYQIQDKAQKFVELAKTPEGIATLLSAENYGDEVKSVDRFFLQPLEKGVYLLDRAEGANKIAIVAGYYDSFKNVARVWTIKPIKHSPGMSFWKSDTYSAGPFNVNLHFTASRMIEINELAPDGTVDPRQDTKMILDADRIDPMSEEERALKERTEELSKPLNNYN